MTKRPFALLLAAGCVALLCVGVSDSRAAPSARPSAIPDFGGIWAHLTFPDVEPPLAGPGPVRNLSHVKNGFCGQPPCLAASSESAVAVSNPYELIGDSANPILKPEAAEIVKQHGEISRKGVPYPTPSNQCWPGGVPFVFWNLGIEVLQQKDEVTIIYAHDNEVRHVRLNQPHLKRVTPSWFGDSVGHYEGGTLVVDTIGIKAGPFAMVDMYGTPHTEVLHVVERYRLLDSDAATQAEERGERENFRIRISDNGMERNSDDKNPGLELQFTVEDPGVFTTPWSAMIVYRRPLGDWPEIPCADSTRDHVGRAINLPHADKPDF